jgi:hypothetical protein
MELVIKEIDEFPADLPHDLIDDFVARAGEEPDNIIPFRHPQFIDLSSFF